MMKELLNYTLSFMKDLLAIPSPTGFADDAIAFVEDEFKKLGLKTSKTYKRALIATIEGEEKEAITFSGHVDTLGLMVKEIRSNGSLAVHRVGGYPYATIVGENVIIKTRKNGDYTGTVVLNNGSVHVHPKDVAEGERNGDTVSVRIDEMVENPEDVKKLGIGIGDFIAIDPRTIITDSGFIKSRHLDDKACVACLVGLAKFMTDKKIKPKYTVNFLVSNYEEVGHGASVVPCGTKDFISVDMAAPDPGQASKETHVTICALDSSGPYDILVRNKLTEAAENAGLDFVTDIYPFYGSDASAALRAGNDIRAGLIGPGVSYSHTYERSHVRGIENTIKLMLEYIVNR